MTPDDLVKAWAASKLDIHPAEIQQVTFEGYDFCYSEWTQDWGVDIRVTFTNGSYRTLSDYGLPEALESIDDYRAALEEAEEMHDHGWDE